MRWTSIMLAMGIAAGLTACQKAPSTPQSESAAHLGAQAAPGVEIAWREGDVDDALAEAKESHKPVLLYWGAKWCPPCNQLKTTLFRDAAFIAETRNFVPVHLDGDTAGAQRWGERFGISGYPTVIVLRADGSEIARLSGAAQGFADVLRVAAGRTTSIDALFDKAEKNPASLTPDEWQLLAAFDWQNDPKHFGDGARAAKLLERLASAAPEGAIKRRFALLALTIGAEEGPDGKYTLTQAQQARIEQVLPAVLDNPKEVVANRQELSYSIPSLVAALPAAQRASLGASLIKALDQVAGNDSLPLPDRLGTLNADITLDTANGGAVSKTVLDKVRTRASWADQTAKEAMVRQSVISNAADLLHQAGDDVGAKKLLEAELKRSASPYYYMLDLASLAEDEKDGPAAIEWSRKAYETATGSATRVQWAIAYSNTVLRQAPDDKAAVETSAQAVIDELGKNSGSYYQRTRVKVTAWGGKLRKWSGAHGGSAVLARLDKRMAGVCSQQGEAAAKCRKWTQVA
jgi:protein disulfide-isomerase